MSGFVSKFKLPVIMIDIHTHVLPAVDDGSPDLRTSLDMLTIAAKCGTTDIIATPHVIEKYNALSWEAILEKVAILQKYAVDNGIPIKIHPGAELEMNWELLALLTNKANSSDYGLAGSNYVLIELPASILPMYAEEFWFELRLSGRIPVLAHPERHAALMRQTALLDKWKKEGLLLQCNTGSLTGLYGSTVQGHIEYLIGKDYVDFIATDAHNNIWRNTDISECRALLEHKFGIDYAERVLQITQMNKFWCEDK